MENTRSGSVRSSRKWRLWNAKKLSGNVICVSHAWALDTGLDNVKPIELVAKMDAASVITFCYIAMRRNPTTQRKVTTKMRRPTTRMQCSQQTRVVGVCELFLSACPAGTRSLRQWFFVTPILRSFLWTRASEIS